MSDLFGSVLHHGARPDGVTDCAPAFQAALATGRTVRVPAGRYLVGRTLRVPSGARIEADAAAHLRLADGAATAPDDFLLTNADPASGNADISIRGGIWDGNNAGNPRPAGLFDYGCTGGLFHFDGVRGLHLENLTFLDAEAYALRLTRTRRFRFVALRFDSTRIRHNNDGVHLGGNCADGHIEDLRGLRPGVTGDDLVALNADDALERCEVRGMTCGPIRRIRIRGLRAEGCHTFVRLLSVHSPIEDIDIEDVAGTCEISAINADAARGCRVPLFDPAAPPFPDGVGHLARIRARGFRVAKSKANDIALLRLETRMSDFLVEDFIRNRAADAAPAAPTLRLRHLPGSRFVLDHHPHRLAGPDDSFESRADRLDRFHVPPRV